MILAVPACWAPAALTVAASSAATVRRVRTRFEVRRRVRVMRRSPLAVGPIAVCSSKGQNRQRRLQRGRAGLRESGWKPATRLLGYSATRLLGYSATRLLGYS